MGTYISKINYFYNVSRETWEEGKNEICKINK